MKPQEKYGQCTAEGCQQTLNEIMGLDDSVTIGELRKFLEKRTSKAKAEYEKARIDLINTFQGKCFKIVYGERHNLLLKIDRIEIFSQYGFVTGAIEGEELSFYEGKLEYSRYILPEKITASNKAKSIDQYINGNDPYTEVPLAHFKEMKKRFDSISL